jgi:hypothetical protein
MSSSDDQNLSALFDALRRADAHGSAPPRVESAVMRAWDASHAPVVSDVSRNALTAFLPVRVSAASWVASLAAAAVLVISLTVVGGRLRSSAIVTPSLAVETSPTVILMGEPVRDGEQIRLVRMRMPASALHALGVTSTVALEDDVDIDVIVGEDGVARALSLNP